MFDDVLDICGARSSSGARCHDRSYTPNCGGWNRSRLPYGAYLHGVPPFISMAVVQVPHFMWFQPYVQAGRGSMLENVFLSTARLRRGVSRSGSVVPRTQSPFVFAWVFFYSWYYFEMGKIYLPPGLEGTNLVVYQPIGTRGQMYAQVGRCACLFAPEFPLVHDLFLEGSCVWN